MNVLWTLFNITILGVATAVAWESQQRRQTVRVTMSVPADILTPDGGIWESVTTDLSSGGVMLLTQTPVLIATGTAIKLVLPVLDGEATLPATVVGVDGRMVRAHFDALTMQEEEALTMVLYSRADTWVGWGQSRERDKPLASLWRILKLSFHGLSHTAPSLMTNDKNPSKTKLATSILPMVLGMAIVPGVMLHVKAQGLAASAPATTVLAQAPGTFDKVFTLADVGQADTILLRGADAQHTVYFPVPQTEVVKAATMKLQYHFSPGLIPKLSHLNVSLNGSLIATLPVETASENSGLLETTLTLPANILVHRNELTFEFIGHYTEQCEDPSHSTLWSRVDTTSSIELQGSLIPSQNELKLLPLPFYDAAVSLHPSVPIVFLSQPSLKAMQAAGIVASWFGTLTGSHAVRFPVTIASTLPQGNVIVISESAVSLLPGLGIGGTSGPTIAMETNPSDPYSKILVLTGINADELLVAAKVLTLQGSSLAGDRQTVGLKDELKRREPDDAPRWLRTDRITTLGEMAEQADLEGDGGAPVDVYFRTPPDLYYGDRQNLALQMNYRYNGIPLANDSTLQLSMNGAYVSSTPMPHTDNASADLSTVIPVPVVDMRPFSNSIKMQFAFQTAKKSGCVDTAPANLRGAILKNSSLDLRDIPHWAPMPNLEIFANAGYPFTRMADLADTAVVLPDQPSTEEIEMYLTLMGHFGAQTGYPVVNVTVTNADGMKPDSGKDYLLMGTADGLKGALAKVSDSLPVKVNSSGLEIEDTRSLLPNAWWKMLRPDRPASGKLEISGGALPDALVEGIEWPHASGRSLVLIVLRDKSMVPNFLLTFLKDSQSSEISQSVSVLKGERFVSYRIGSDAYHVGSLSWWTQTNLWFSEFPGMLIGLVLLVCFLMAVLLAAILRRRARRRLLGLD